MTSPNPFYLPSGLRGDFSPSEAPSPEEEASSSPTLSFKDIPRISKITLCRGAYRATVGPYSLKHAFLTGQLGTPSKKNRMWMQYHSRDFRDVDVITLDVQFKPFHGGCIEMSLATKRALAFGPPLPARPSYLQSGPRARCELAAPRLALLANLATIPGDGPAQQPPLKALFSSRVAETSEGSLESNASSASLEYPDTDGEQNDAEHLGTSRPQPTILRGYWAVPAEFEHGKLPFTNLKPGALNCFYPKGEFPRGGKLDAKLCPLQAVKVFVAEWPSNLTGRPVDALLLRKAGIQIHYPTTSIRVSNARLLRESITSEIGITLAEFGRIYRVCFDCGRYIFTDRACQHSCYGNEVDVGATGFCLISYLSSNKYGGLTLRDLEKVYFTCETCLHIFSSAMSFYHHCPDPDLPDSDDTTPL